MHRDDFRTEADDLVEPLPEAGQPIALSEVDAQAFAEMLFDPTAPNDALRRGLESHRALIG